jgi:hypothetical protein
MRCQETFRGDRKSEIDNPEVDYPLQRIALVFGNFNRLPGLREAAQGLCDAASSSPGLQRPKTEEFGFELSNLYITKEDLVEVFCNKFKA